MIPPPKSMITVSVFVTRYMDGKLDRASCGAGKVSGVLKVILNTQTQKIDLQITANHWNAGQDTTPIPGGTKTGFFPMHSESAQKLPDLYTFSRGSWLVPKKTHPRRSAGLDSWYNRIRSSKFGFIDWNKLFGGYNPGWIFFINLNALAYLYPTIYWHTRGFSLFLTWQKASSRCTKRGQRDPVGWKVKLESYPSLSNGFCIYAGNCMGQA